LVELTIDEPSPIEVIINYPLDIGSLEIGADQTVVFRPALREFFVETAPLVVAAQDSSYLFEYPLIYSNAGPGLPIGPITVSAIAEEQIILGSLAELYEYSDILPLVIAAQDVFDTNRLELEFDTTLTLSIDSTGVVTANYPRTESVGIEISANEVVSKKFVFIDTLTLVVDISDSIKTRQVIPSTIPLSLGASAGVKISLPSLI
jgi:hypothetical protein